jgi:DNA end-binding protein Ku
MPLESAMVLVKLRWPAEVRSLDELALGPDVTKAELSKGELDMAKRLVQDMSVDWSPDDYRDEFEDKIMALVDKKAHEGKIEDVETATGEEERKTADVIDLTELLKRSLGGKAATKAPAKPKSTTKPAARKKVSK